MGKFKRKNPAWDKEFPQLWVLVASMTKKKVSYNEIIAAAVDAGFTPRMASDYKYELGTTGMNSVARMKQIAAERLPQRDTLRKVPFYLRKRTTWLESAQTYIPDVDYSRLSCYAAKFAPINADISKLYNRRMDHIKRHAEGLVRWTETISRDSTITVCKTFDDFSFKIDAGTAGNALPTVKQYGGLKLHITAPLEFINSTFWGLGEHLVVRVIDKYETSDGVRVWRTKSCTREDLYQLNRPNRQHERYYVFFEDRKATGLTEVAALKSMGYFMGKEIAHQMGV